MRSLRRAIRAGAVVATVTAAAITGAIAMPASRSSASVGTVSFSATPALYPAFSPDVSDYVVRCSAETPVQVSVANSDTTDTTTTISVDGQAPRIGTFDAFVSIDEGQEFTITIRQGQTQNDYFVRCLPADFPNWTSARQGTPQAEYYVVAPSLGATTSRYVMIYDTNGVPIWWALPPAGYKAVDAKLAPNGDILWTESNGPAATAQERRLDASIVNGAIAPVGFATDVHDVQLLPNGDYLVMGDYGRCCYDLTAHGGPASATIFDMVIQETTPTGSALWTWDAADHIGLDEVVAMWWPTIVSQGTPYDVFHMNSVEMDAAGDLLISTRHNGIYKVRNPAAATGGGKVIWKLGGTAPTMEPGTQLTIIGDPVFDAGSGFGGQHYARYYDAGDGNLYVTLHDNGTNLGRPPRGVRYRIDEAAGTATMIEDVRDNIAPDFRSICCGSAMKLPGGDWVMSWGLNDSMMELTPAGDRVYVITFSAPSYRADPVLPGVLTRAALRAGMDAQYPRVPEDTDDDGCPDAKEALLAPPTNPNDPWDFYSVPVPALLAAPNPLIDVRDNAVTAADAQAVFAYFKAGAKSGTTIYEQDLNNDNVTDGVEYDRTVLSPGESGPPDGVITASDAQLAFAQFKNRYNC